MPAPIITSVSTGGLPPGAVRIDGSGFLNTTGVTFGSTPVISFSVKSDTAILALPVSGSNTGTVVITVTTPLGSITAAVTVGESPPPIVLSPGVSPAGFLGAVASQAAMLELVGDPGVFCYRTDLSELLFLIDSPPSVVDNWTASGSSTNTGGVDGGSASSTYGGLVLDGGTA